MTRKVIWQRLQMRLIRVCAFLACNEVMGAHWFDKSALPHQRIIPWKKTKPDTMFTVMDFYRAGFKSVQAYFLHWHETKTHATHLKSFFGYSVRYLHYPGALLLFPS